MAKHELPSLTLQADEARRSGVRLSLDLTDAQRARLADDNGLAGVTAFQFRGKATGLSGRRLKVDGELNADVSYTCGVSLRPYAATIREPVVQVYCHQKKADEVIDLDPFDDDDVEPFINGEARISDLVYELFTLALDPYPRHPDLAAVSQDDEDGLTDEEEKPSSPFAVLKDLKL